MSLLDKPIVKIKTIYRKPKKIKYKGKVVIIRYKRKKVKIYKCKHCNFKQLNAYKNGRYLRAHLTKIHRMVFLKGQSQQTRTQNAIMVLSQFDELESKELVWSCPFCGKEFVHTHIQEDSTGKDYNIEHVQITRHLDFCPKYPEKLKK